MRSSLFILCFTIILLTSAEAQTPHEILPYSFQFYQKFDQDAYNPTTNTHTALKPYFLDNSLFRESVRSALNFGIDTNRKNWFSRKIFNEHLVEVNKEDYTFYGDILPDLSIGRDIKGHKNTWLNSRGYQFGGTVGSKFSFYTSGYENQGRFPEYYNKYVNAIDVIPGQSYDRSKGDKEMKDWSYVTALLSYTPVKYLNITAGQDKTFIGDGYRSMLLSDYASNYPFIKLTANLGNVQYMSMWASLQDPSAKRFSYDTGYRKKGGVFHYLDWNVNKRLSIGFFDAIIWGEYDDAGNRRGFDWAYANPLIFLRPLEAMGGSPDNAVLGLTGKYELLDNISLYGQFLLDEFTAKEFFGGKGYWANKFGLQAGLRGHDAFNIQNLNYLAEFNTARPYTYSGRTTILNYGQYYEPLAHPLGANFREFLTIWNYSFERFQFYLQGNYAQYGLNPADTNFGKNIFKSYDTRFSDYGNKTGQGVKTNLMFLNPRISFLLNPKTNMRLEIGRVFRKESNSLGSHTTSWITFGLRSSFRNLYYDF